MKKLSWALSLIAAILLPVQAFAWFPLSNTVPQYEDANGNPYSGAVLKAYAAGTSTPISMATDSTGATTVSTITLNASGYPSVSGNVVIPYVNERYKLALYPTSAAATANTGAIWTQDNIAVSGDFGAETQSITTSTVLDAADNFNHIEASGTITITLPDIDAVGSGFVFTIRNASTGLVTLDGDGSEQINGASTIILYPGDSALIQSGSAAWSAVAYKSPQAEVDVASATTTDIGAAASDSVRITGTTTITGLGTAAAGITKKVRFADALTLTHNATSLILPGGANITTAANDRLEATSLGSGNWLIRYYEKASGSPLQVLGLPITGFLPSSIAGNSTTASLTVSAGSAIDSTGTFGITKTSTTSWAVSNGNAINGYQGGTTLPNSDTIHVFMCYGTSGVGSFAHNAVTPTCPSGYNTGYRRVHSFNTTGAGAPIPYTAVETAGGGYRAILNTITAQSASLTTSASSITVASAPTDIRVSIFFRTAMSVNPSYAIWSALDAADAAPAVNGTAPGASADQAGTQSITGIEIMTNTSGQIRGRASTTASAYIYFDWFDDFRR